MDDHTLHGLLGDTYAETTPEQRAAISTAADRIADRWPDPDLEDVRREALNAAIAVILGDDTLEDVAQVWHRTRATERDAHAALTGALIASADQPETTLERRTGVTRTTVRKALGK